MNTNKNSLIKLAVSGEISHPTVSKGREWRISPEGHPVALPGVGGISYNCKVGESAVEREADHAEPGVSVKTDNSGKNNALNLLACIGNQARVVSGDAKGEYGVVTGKHGGIDHILVDFPQEVLEKLCIGDSIQIRSYGLGLKVCDYPSVSVMNLDPEVLEKLVKEKSGGGLEAAVAFCLPPEAMGSGIGRSHVFSGDYDIQFSNNNLVEKLGLNNLRLGDLVAIKDQYHTYGRSHMKGAVSIGVVAHTICVQAGHGPGITTILSCKDGTLETVEREGANIADILGIGSSR